LISCSCHTFQNLSIDTIVPNIQMKNGEELETKAKRASHLSSIKLTIGLVIKNKNKFINATYVDKLINIYLDTWSYTCCFEISF
jgi:hypothetical protein